ncbi:MAG TPA: hypothetical protein VHK64_04165 [Nocardioidaceae bacterium]|jgi:hypothetical protein|nr:hypothetical protein [Nocardioidaceae bacterium]
MRWPFVSRAVHETVLADRERIRGERDQFEKDRNTQTAVARKATEQYADLYDRHTATAIVNGRLTEDLTAARELLTAPANDWRTKYEAERKRADHLQRRLDDALGLNTTAIEDGRLWQSTRTDVVRKPVAP